MDLQVKMAKAMKLYVSLRARERKYKPAIFKLTQRAK
jgi:hypothetical protein